MCHAIHWYGKASNKYMEDYEPNKESSDVIYWDNNNLYEWKMSQKLPMDGFEWQVKKKQAYIQWRIHTRLWQSQWQKIYTWSWC